MPDMTFESRSTARFLTSENNKLLCVISSFSNMLQNKWLYHNSICQICVFNPRWLLLHNGHCGCNGFMCADEGLPSRGAGKRSLYSTKLRLNSDTKWTSRETAARIFFQIQKTTIFWSLLFCVAKERGRQMKNDASMHSVTSQRDALQKCFSSFLGSSLWGYRHILDNMEYMIYMGSMLYKMLLQSLPVQI